MLSDNLHLFRFPDTIPSMMGSVVVGLQNGIQSDQAAMWKTEKMELQVREQAGLTTPHQFPQRYCSHLETINNRLIIEKVYEMRVISTFVLLLSRLTRASKGVCFSGEQNGV